MAVINFLKRNWKEIVLCFFTIQSIFAEMMSKGRTRVKKVLNIYHQNSNDGGQVVDNSKREEVNVFEPMVFIEHQINEDTAITGSVLFDIWTAASDTKIDDYTGASDKPIMGQGRIDATLGVKREKKVGLNHWSYASTLGFSKEYDYRSLNAQFDISRSFAKDNFTLGSSIQYFQDEVDLFQDISSPQRATLSQGLDRKIFAATLMASQILTAKDIAQFGITFVRASGALESTANTVDILGSKEVEKLPHSRSRYALSSQWVHGLSNLSSLNLSYRYYWDQWDLSSHTIRAAYLYDIEEDESYMELFGRYYRQSELRYYARSFGQVERFMTSDSDMGNFYSIEGGLFYESSLKSFKIFSHDFDDVSLSHSLVLGNRSNGMRYGYYQMGFAYNF